MATTPETSRTGRIAIWATVVVVIVLAVLGIRSFTRERVAVRVARPTIEDLSSSVNATGKVEPVNEFQAHAIAPGVVERIYVNVGTKVRQGDMLIRMNDADALGRLAAARSFLSSSQLAEEDMKNGGSQDERNNISGDMTRAQIEHDQATSNLANLQRLQAQGAASIGEVNAAKLRLQYAETQLHAVTQHSTARYGPADRKRIEAQLADAQAAVASAEAAVANADIRSPIAGTVYSIPVSQYDYIRDGTEDLLDVADLDHLQVRAYFDEPEIGPLAAGQPVRIVWDAKGNLSWHGHIQRAPTTVISYGPRNVGECLISVDNPKDLEPNSNVTVTVTTSQHLHALSIPREGLHTTGGASFVFRVLDGKLVRTPVQVGVVNLTRAEIVSGLTDRDVVALNSTTNRDLADGLEVTSVE